MSWLEHVSQYRKEHPDLPYKLVLSKAKDTYEGGSKKSSYVAKLYATNKADPSKLKKNKPKVIPKNKDIPVIDYRSLFKRYASEHQTQLQKQSFSSWVKTLRDRHPEAEFPAYIPNKIDIMPYVSKELYKKL